MKEITVKQYNDMCNDYKGIYMDYQGTHPELKGKRSIVSYKNGATVLLIEGLNLKIID